jgi:heme A synthase
VLLAALVIVQIALGGWTVLSAKRPEINTAHVATGSLVLAISLVLALRANRARFHDVKAVDADPVASAPRIETRSSIGARA